jgi:hypothetical protein
MVLSSTPRDHGELTGAPKRWLAMIYCALRRVRNAHFGWFTTPETAEFKLAKIRSGVDFSIPVS